MCLALSRLSGETNLTAQASSVGGKKHSVSTGYVLKVLGLDVCSDAVVGDDMLRGISGGQRKRVTTGLSLSLPLSLRWPKKKSLPSHTCGFYSKLQHKNNNKRSSYVLKIYFGSIISLTHTHTLYIYIYIYVYIYINWQILVL
jgi:hypothetical protein